MPPREEDYLQLKERLDQCMSWPTDYVFKFIVRITRREELLELFTEDFYTERLSKDGNYYSLTLVRHVENSDQIIAIYKLVAHRIPGVIML